MAAIVGGAIAGSMVSSLYEKVELEIFKDKDEEKEEDVVSTKIVVNKEKPQKKSDCQILDAIAILSVMVVVTYGAYKIIKNI